MNELQCIFSGFADTLDIFRKYLPTKQKKRKKKRSTSASYLSLKDLQSVYNAVENVKILRKLIVKIGIRDNVIKTNAKSLLQIIKDKEISNEHTSNKTSLKCLTGVSVDMLTKISKAGINYTLLKESYIILAKRKA